MEPFEFIIQNDEKGLDWGTQSKIKTHAMMNYLRRRGKEKRDWNSGGSRAKPTTTVSKARQDEHYHVFRVNGASTRKKSQAILASSGSKSRNQGTQRKQPTICMPQLGLSDVASVCGTYSFDGVDYRLSQKIIDGLQYHVNSHLVASPNIDLPVHSIFSSYLLKHFFGSRAAFFAISLKVLLYNSLENNGLGKQWISSQDFYRLKTAALHAINQEIQSASHVKDSTICGTVCILMFENAIGSDEGLIHLRGLHHIYIKEQTGMEQTNIFSRAISWLDLMGSVLYNTDRSLEEPKIILRLRKPKPTASYERLEARFYPSSPLQHVDGDLSLPASVPLNLAQLLDDAFILVDIMGNGGKELGTMIDDVRAQIQAHLETFSVSPAGNSKASRLNEICRLTAWIHWRAVDGRVPHHKSPENVKDCKKIWNLMKDTSVSDWMHMPFIYLWIILTGAATSNPAEDFVSKSLPSDRMGSFFYSRLCQFMLTVGLIWTNDFEDILLNFYWIQHQLRQRDMVYCEL